jgi:hypothetical protein
VTTSHQDSALIAECAGKHGVTVRSVQKWRKTEDRRWLEFLRTRASAAAGQIGLFSAPQHERLTPQQEEDQASRRYAGLAALADRAIEAGNFLEMNSLITSAEKAHKLLKTVRDNTQSYLLASGKLVPADEVSELILGNLSLVKRLIENLPDVLAARIESSSDVGGIVRAEIHSILREISSSVRSMPFIQGPAAPSEPFHESESQTD